MPESATTLTPRNPAKPQARPSNEPAPRVALVTPQQTADWNAYVHQHENGTLFHAMGWRDAVRDSFGHLPTYLVATSGQRITGVLPIFLVKSRLAGRMLVSVPYGVDGGMLVDDEATGCALFSSARDLAHQHNCRVIDLRSRHAGVSDLETVDRYVGFHRSLPESVDDVPGWLPRKARAAARNAHKKYGVTISYGDENLKTAWNLYGENMRRLASLTYPYRFFEKLIEGTPDRHWVALAHWQGRPVAGLITFLFGDTVMPYFFGASSVARRCSAANLLYLSAMQRSVEAGYRVFDFGRSRRDNEGSFNFKRFHGFEPTPLGYQVWTRPGVKPPNLTPTNPKLQAVRWCWRRLPLFATRSLGAYVSRHIPG